MGFEVRRIFQNSIFLFLLSFSLFGELPVKKSGKLFGILTAKGEAWIQVKEDGGLASRYLAPWEGSSPSRGGGFDQKFIRVINQLVVGNRVILEWFWDGHLRIDKVKEFRPYKKSGVFSGTLVKKGPRWIDVESEQGQVPWRFYARWVGGLPEQGGSYHEKTIEFFDNFKVYDPVRFAWSYDIRPRIERFVEQEKEEAFVPFYEGKVDPNLPVSPSTPSVSPSVNPFEQSKLSSPLNPFDQVPATNNPFEQVEKTENPFEQLPTNNQNPFDAVDAIQGNPFESSEIKAQNPFEAVDQKIKDLEPKKEANPFENLPEKKTKEEDPIPANPFENVPLPGNPFEAVPQ